MNVLERAQQPLGPRLRSSVTARHALLIALLAAAAFTRFWRLGTPDQCYFDEVYFPTTGAEILRGDAKAWEFYGHENTHPPLSKLFMAGGMAIFGHEDRSGKGDNQCWSDAEDAAKKADPAWTYNPFGWRFFGALAGVGSVLFIYLLGKRLFKSEIAGMAAAFFLTLDGLAFAQARIATPDTYVLFFVLGSVYFLLANRFLLSGVFWGAALASKWTALFTVFPIVLYLLYRYRQREQGRGALLLYLAPLSLLAFYMGTPLLFGQLLLDCEPSGACQPSPSADVFGTGLATWMLLWALAPLVLYVVYRLWRPGGSEEDKPLAAALVGLPLYFVLVPLFIYLLTYLPMLLNGHDLKDAWELNKQAYLFHSYSPVVAGPDAWHPYKAPWDTWPILMRPVFFFVSGNARIYNLGNPLIFWVGLPALAFVLWQGLRPLRARLDAKTGDLSVWGTLGPSQAALLFVLLTYLGFWLPWARQPRLMFLYHYLTALPFLMLALAYVIHKLWHHQQPWGRVIAVAFLTAVAATFIYFYPQLAAVPVSGRLADSYYWFPSWR